MNVIHLLARGPNSHTWFITFQNFQFWLFRHGAPKAALCRNIPNWEFWQILSDMYNCLSLVRENISLSHRNHPGYEEISTSRWARDILKLSRSNSDKSYGLGKSNSLIRHRRKKNTPYASSVHIKKIQNYINRISVREGDRETTSAFFINVI